MGADSPAILPAKHLGRQGERHLLPEDVRHLDPRPVVEGDVEVVGPEFEVPRFGGAAVRRDEHRPELPFQPQRDGLRAAVAFGLPLGGEGSAGLEIPPLQGEEKGDREHPARAERIRIHPLEKPWNPGLPAACDDIQPLAGDFGRSYVQKTHFPENSKKSL